MADKDKDKDEKKEEEVETPKPDGNGALPGVGDSHFKKWPKKT